MPPTKPAHTTTATFASCCSKIRKSSGLRSHDINQSGCGARYQIQHIRYVSDSTVCVFFYFATVAESPNRQLKMASEKILITCSDLICLLRKLVQHDPISEAEHDLLSRKLLFSIFMKSDFEICTYRVRNEVPTEFCF